MSTSLEQRIKALEVHVFGEKCESCGEFESFQKACDACKKKFCKCNTFYNEGDYFSFCSPQCLVRDFDQVCLDKTCDWPIHGYKEQVMEQYKDRK